VCYSPLAHELLYRRSSTPDAGTARYRAPGLNSYYRAEGWARNREGRGQKTRSRDFKANSCRPMHSRGRADAKPCKGLHISFSRRATKLFVVWRTTTMATRS